MKTIHKLTVLSALLSLSSCGDMLELTPPSSIVAENFWKTAGDAEAGLMNAYNSMQNSMTQNFIIVPLVLADDARANSGGNFTRHESFVATPVHGNVLDHWRDVYAAVHGANDVLANVPNINDPALQKDRVLGEAYFIRSWAFFQLTRLWGKIPLPLQPSKSATQDFQLKRSEVAEVYAQIIKDLQEAEKLLPAAHPGNNRARPAKGSARAWLAKVYLQRNAQGDYALALAECEKVMADAQYRLVPGANFASIFAVGSQNTTETIFEASFRPNRSTEGHDLDNETVPFSGAGFRMRPETKIINAFQASTGDLRAAVSLGTHNNNRYIRKYEAAPPTTNIRGNQTTNIVYLRLADIILLRAECLNELGRTAEAIPFLNQIRTRAGLQPTTATSQAQVKQAIEDERFLELAFEPHRWYDLVRWNKAVGTVANLTEANRARILWPIPSRELDLNPNLDQNPSY
ncbi:RagB/SusD family nutrient uptake outer membrane protein [Fibrisoma montanum]|uniref:RagB/SusD family nutrient uptake outer membrane protein n=1 Tax=Fibrisoma montanum TaxID=2305895 RepID=A0A418MAX0_9BACT|nr:RagB/SusD family nutrient uptake outer membrane protein [Fibrisoma montanum]RIV23519.1 RagB/SusD family nutrient uptake outer membrane protein [Fibrisoma montanum]